MSTSIECKVEVSSPSKQSKEYAKADTAGNDDVLSSTYSKENIIQSTEELASSCRKIKNEIKRFLYEKGINSTDGESEEEVIAYNSLKTDYINPYSSSNGNTSEEEKILFRKAKADLFKHLPFEQSVIIRQEEIRAGVESCNDYILSSTDESSGYAIQVQTQLVRRRKRKKHEAADESHLAKRFKLEIETGYISDIDIGNSGQDDGRNGSEVYFSDDMSAGEAMMQKVRCLSPYDISQNTGKLYSFGTE